MALQAVRTVEEGTHMPAFTRQLVTPFFWDTNEDAVAFILWSVLRLT